jgi:protein-disulfide isomerase
MRPSSRNESGTFIRMRYGKIFFCAGLIAMTIIAGALSLWVLRSDSLEFKERSFPEGFRELVLASGVSRFDPILGLWHPPSTSQDIKTKRNVRDVCDELFRDPDSPAIGDERSSVRIVAFFDYRCPYCRTLTRILFGMLSGNLQLIFKEWPVLGDSSVLAARAALAVAKQGRYPAFHQRLMESRFVPTTSLVENLAAELGTNQSQLREDMNGKGIALAISRNRALASELEFAGTPTLVVGRTVVQGAVTRSQLESLIRAESIGPNICQ